MASELGDNLYIAISKHLVKIRDRKGIGTKAISIGCEKFYGVKVTEKEVGSILNASTIEKKTYHGIDKIEAVCKFLGTSLADILKNVTIPRNEAEKDKFNKEFARYTSEYQVYFFSPGYGHKTLKKGRLKFEYIDNSCKAEFELFFTYNSELYTGHFDIIEDQKTVYVNLEADSGKLLSFAFSTLKNEEKQLNMRVANALSSSNFGDVSTPSVFRLFICKEEIQDDKRDFLMSQLMLNTYEVVISAKEYKYLLKELTAREKEIVNNFFPPLRMKDSSMYKFKTERLFDLRECGFTTSELGSFLFKIRSHGSMSYYYDRPSDKEDFFLCQYLTDEDISQMCEN